MRTTAASLILAALAEGEYANDSANVAEARKLHVALGAWLAECDAPKTCHGCSYLETSTNYCHARPAFLSASLPRCSTYHGDK